MRIVLGLGNPGGAYRHTRHNVGFDVADLLAARWGKPFGARADPDLNAWVVEAPVRGDTVILAKPATWMNRAGRAAGALSRHYGAAPPDFIVIHDDADLELGRIRVRPGGGTGGHQGVRSVVEVLGAPDFARVRLGVRGAAREARDLADYVLEPFEPFEVPVVEDLLELGADAVETVLREGVARAMNLFNQRTASEDGPSETPEP